MVFVKRLRFIKRRLTFFIDTGIMDMVVVPSNSRFGRKQERTKVMEEKIKKDKYRKTIYACFTGYIVQAVINNFVPLLFLTFQST